MQRMIVSGRLHILTLQEVDLTGFKFNKNGGILNILNPAARLK